MRRRPVAIYRVIDEEELLGADVDAPYVGTAFEEGDDLVAVGAARPRRVTRWLPALPSVLGLAVMALLLLASSAHRPAAHTRASHATTATVARPHRGSTIDSPGARHGAAASRVAPRPGSILTVEPVRPQPGRRREARRSHIERERVRRARRPAERAFRTAGPLEVRASVQEAATAPAHPTAADPSQEFGFER